MMTMKKIISPLNYELLHSKSIVVGVASNKRWGGAALIVVLAMTGLLMFLGFFFFSFVAAERNSAGWFASTSRSEITESDYFDFALQGILIGPTDDLRSSALYGRKYSIIPNMLGSFGSDLRPKSMQPFTGSGINVLFQDTNNDGLPDAGTSAFGFDYNADGIADDSDKDSNAFDPTTGGTFDGNDIVINFSPAANRAVSGGVTYPVSPLGFPNHPNFVPDFEPDAGYTYPDINSMFLGYFSLIDVNPDPAVETLRRVWIPSFHRPQYLPRDETVDIYSSLEYANRVLRPHREHLVRLRYRDPGNINNVLSKTVRRYVAAGGFDPATGTAGPANGFPFPTFATGSNPTDYEAGLWTGGLARHADISYDVDADGLSINGKEAILLDLNHGVEILGDGRKRIPMFAITIMDADGLLNLNTAGNLYGEPTSLVHSSSAGAGAFGNTTYVSRSNFGLSMGELNPSRAFYRPLDQPGGTPTLLSNSYRRMFGIDLTSAAVSQLDMSNMELARLLVGVADGNTADDTDVVAGRWGDSNLIDNAVSVARANIGNPSVITAPQPPYPAFSRFSTSLSAVTFPVQFPAPGRPGFDDDEDYFTGAGKARLPGGNSFDPVFGRLGISIPPSVHPSDELGIGRYSYLSDFSATNVLQFVAQANRGAQRRAANTGDFNLALIDAHQKNPGRWVDYGASITGIGDVAGFDYQIPVAPASARPNVADTYDTTATTPVAGVTPYSQSGFEGLFGWGQLNRHVHRFTAAQREWSSYLADEPDEIAVEPAFRDLNNDGLFSVNDMAFLHVSDLDWTKIGSPNRLEKLLEFNFERLTVTEPTTGFTPTNGVLVRSQFTTDSWDRWEFGMSRVADTDNDGSIQDEIRGWEFNDNLSNLAPDGVANQGIDTWRFPPSFATSAGASHAPYGINDPFRYEVRQWLTIEYADDPKNIFNHNRLDLNRLLAIVHENGKPVLQHRHLTPHTTNGGVFGGSGTDVIPDMEHRNIYDPQDSRLPFPFSAIGGSKVAQEWWARYDRQRMARDIYVLLYTLGGGDDTLNYTLDNSSNQLYTNEQLREMAQFAVNVVDALDRDDVITEFVYDRNLGDGWDISGLKVASTGNFLDTTGETARVFGVERQSLCFSESLWIKTTGNLSTDEDSTIFNDTDPDRHHIFLELQNASSFPVSLDGGNWRIRRVDIDTTSDPPVETTVGSVVIRDSLANSYPSSGAKLDVANIVEPGGYYTIGHHDGNDDLGGNQRPSDYRVETGTPTEYQVLAPAKWARWRYNSLTAPAATLSSDAPDPWVDLDLTWSDTNEEGRYEFRDASENRLDPSSTKGFILTDSNLPPSGTTTTFVLERRLHTNLPDNFNNNNTSGYNQQKVWNPWVEVDRIEMEQQTFNPSSPSYSGLPSKEISEPLASNDFGDYGGGASGVDGKSYNTLGELNDRSSAQFTLWQPHFDRDFTSVYDLLAIPIFGPSPKTVEAGSGRQIATGGITKILSNGRRLSGFANVNGLVRPVLAGTAKFMRPDNEPSVPVTAAAGTAPADTTLSSYIPADSTAANDNRWYRLFEFYEVKTTAQSAFRDDLPIPRTPGKVNLNTVRHPGVLAGIIDDTYHLRNHTNPVATTEEGNARIPFRQLRDPKEAARDWGKEFFQSRDVADPILSTSNNVYLPGIPGSRPFRPMSFLGHADPANVADIARQTIEQTLLRSLPLDDGLGQQESVLDRRLFEARTRADMNQAATGLPGANATFDAVDFHTRNRILGKIANNTTVRSNVFYCWIYVQFHEAAEDEFGNVQIGGVMPDQPVHRAFFVIDRSKLEEAWDPKTKTFNWRKFVTLRNVIQ